MPRIHDDTTKLLREVWLKAARDPKGFVLDCGDQSTAIYYRMRLYRVAKPVRDRPEADPEFAEALAFLSISAPTDGKLHIAPMTSKGTLASIAAQVGFDPRKEAEGAATAEEAELTKRVAEELERKLNPGGLPQANRYNTRG